LCLFSKKMFECKFVPLKQFFFKKKKNSYSFTIMIITIMLLVFSQLGAYIICQACAEGTYSLVSNVTLDTNCKYCGSYDQIMQCEKNIINLNQG